MLLIFPYPVWKPEDQNVDLQACEFICYFMYECKFVWTQKCAFVVYLTVVWTNKTIYSRIVCKKKKKKRIDCGVLKVVSGYSLGRSGEILKNLLEESGFQMRSELEISQHIPEKSSLRPAFLVLDHPAVNMFCDIIMYWHHVWFKWESKQTWVFNL